MLERDALVAEILADLVDALQPSHDQPLEIQLGGHAQVERAVELVVVRREGACARAAVERLQDRRLDLDESRPVEVCPPRRDHAGTPLRVVAHVGVDHQIDVAMTVARLDVREAVMQVGDRALAGCQQLKLLESERELTAPARDGLARDADDVTELRLGDGREELLAEIIGAGEQLQPPAAVLETEERGLAVHATRHRPACQAVTHARDVAGCQLAMRRPHLGDLGAVGEAMWKLIEPAALAHAGTLMLTILSLSTPAGTLTSTSSPFLWPYTARPTGDSFERLAGGRIGLGRADDRVGQRVAVVEVLHRDLRTDGDGVGSRPAICRSRAPTAGAPRGGRSGLEHRLLVLRVVVLGVLGDVAELARLADPLGDLPPLVGPTGARVRACSLSYPSGVRTTSFSTIASSVAAGCAADSRRSCLHGIRELPTAWRTVGRLGRPRQAVKRAGVDYSCRGRKLFRIAAPDLASPF